MVVRKIYAVNESRIAVLIIMAVLWILPRLLTPGMVDVVDAMVVDAGPVTGLVTEDVVYKRRLIQSDLLLDIYHPLTAVPTFSSAAPVVDEPGMDLKFVLVEYGPTDLVAMADGDAFGYSRSLRLVPERLLERYSPVRYVAQDWPPVLIFHGEEDEVVSIRQSERLVAELERWGVTYEYHPIPGGNHGFFNMSQSDWEEMEDACLRFIVPLM